MLRKVLGLMVAGIVCAVAIHWRRAPVVVPESEITSTVAAGEKMDSPVRSTFAANESSPADHDRLSRLWKDLRDGLNSDDATARETALGELLPQLVALNPAAAARFAETAAPDASRRDVLHGIAQAWAAKDADGALAWAAQLPNEQEKQTALADAIVELSTSDPARAVDAARQYSLNSGAFDLLPTLAVQWANQDLTGAITWARTLPGGEQRDEIMARIVFVESQNAPVTAGNRVLTEIASTAVQQEAVMTVLHQWSLKDMGGALAWAENFPEGSLKDRALAELSLVNQRRN